MEDQKPETNEVERTPAEEMEALRIEEQQNLTGRSRLLLEAARLEYKAAQVNVQRAMGLGVLPVQQGKAAKKPKEVGKP